MLNEWRRKEIDDLRGQWTDVDQIAAKPNRASLAQNVRIKPGRVETRDGIAAVFPVTGRLASFYNWLTAGLNRLIYLENDTNAKMRDLVGGTTTTLFSQAAKGLVTSEFGDKAFIASFNSAGSGAGPCRIVLPLFVSGSAVDVAFAPPWTVVPVISDDGAGNCSEGTHNFGFIVETRTGFTGKPSPAPADVFTPVAFTVSAGGRKLKFQLTVTVPADAYAVHVIMTRSDNLDKYYFVPGASAATPTGFSGTVNISINISDDLLEEDAESADDHFDALTQTVAGTAPFLPSSVVAYGKRQVYIADDVVYASDVDDPQFITAALHRIRLASQKRFITGSPFRSSLYLFGPHWTYETSDSGGVPKTWATPTEISASIGTPAIHGVEWRTGGDYIWVAAEGGLYLFDGHYPDKPVTYYESAWKRINWTAAVYSLIVRDDFVNRRVYVAAPLDAATDNTILFVIDYTRGRTPETVDITIDQYHGGDAFSAIGVVQDQATGTNQMWIAIAANVCKQTPSAVDANGIPTDLGAQVTTIYETGQVLTPADPAKRLNTFRGVEISVSGKGTLSGTLYGAGRVDSDSLTADENGSALTLATAPDEAIFAPAFLDKTKNASVRLQTTGKMILESIALRWKPRTDGA